MVIILGSLYIPGIPLLVGGGPTQDIHRRYGGDISGQLRVYRGIWFRVQGWGVGFRVYRVQALN